MGTNAYDVQRRANSDIMGHVLRKKPVKATEVPT
jgi:hypothetical protein